MSDGRGIASTQLNFETEGGDRAEIKNLPAPVMQALYYELTGKKEQLFVYFDGDFKIQYEDIRALVGKIEQTLSVYNIIASNVIISLTHLKKETFRCSSLEKFSQYDITKTDPIKALNVKLDFVIQPAFEGAKSQNYSVDVDINSYVLLKGAGFAQRGIGGDQRNTPRCITFKIEFVDYVVARALQALAGEWVESLPKIDFQRWRGLGGDYFDLAYRIETMAKIVVSLSATWALCYWSGIYSSAIAWTSAFVLIGFYTLLYNIVEMIFEYADSGVRAYLFFPFIVLNTGDRRNYDLFIKRTKKNSAIGKFIFLILIVSVLVNLLSSYIYDQIR